MLSPAVTEETKRRLRREEMHRRIKLAVQTDTIKPAHVPFDTLGKTMIDRVKHDIGKRVLVVSDLGLLVAVLNERHAQSLNLVQGLVFLCHTQEQREFAEAFGVETRFVSYGSELETFLAGEGKYNTEVMKKFDVIVGNPPFQSTEKSELDKGSGTRSNLWPKLIDIAFRLINQDGHIVMVTPGNWRRGGKVSCNDVIWSNQILWYQSAKTPIDYFPDVGHSIDIGSWHIVVNGKVSNTALSRRRLLPKQNIAIDVCEKFFRVCETGDLILEGFKGQRNYEGMIYKSPIGDEARPYRIAGTSAQVKRSFWNWSSTKPLNFDKRKVVVCDSGQFLVGYDDGTYGTGDHTASYVVSSEQEASCLIKFLSSELVKFISLQFMQEDALGYPANLFAILPRALLHNPWQQVFNFTDEEVALIISHAK